MVPDAPVRSTGLLGMIKLFPQQFAVSGPARRALTGLAMSIGILYHHVIV